MTLPPEDRESAERLVLAANQAFYDAFEARDFDAMSNLWEHSSRVFCTHPGWGTLHGWAAVSASWVALFTQGAPLQFIVTGPNAAVQGDAAWVTCDENILGGGTGTGGTVAAVNLFTRDEEGSWRMVGHHGSPVAS